MIPLIDLLHVIRVYSPNIRFFGEYDAFIYIALRYSEYMSRKNPEIRSIQKSGSEYYRMSLPKQYVEQLKEKRGSLSELQVIMSDDFIIIRPEPSEIKPKGEFHFNINEMEDIIGEDDPYIGDFDANILDKYVGKVLQGFIMSGAQEISITYDGFDRRKRIKVEQALKSQEMSPDINYISGEDKVYIRDSNTQYLTQYIRSVCDFLETNLINILEDEDATFSDYPSIMSMEDEERLDRLWSLTTRQCSRNLLELNRSEFPKSFAVIQIGKYLESIVDISKRIFESFEQMEDNIRNKEALQIFQRKVYDILNESMRYDDQLNQAVDRASTLEVGTNDYKKQLEIYSTRISKIEEIRQKNADWWEDSTSESLDQPIQFGRYVGDISTLTERLVRFPRSIVLAGHTARIIRDVYEIEPQEF